MSPVHKHCGKTVKSIDNGYRNSLDNELFCRHSALVELCAIILRSAKTNIVKNGICVNLTNKLEDQEMCMSTSILSPAVLNL